MKEKELKEIVNKVFDKVFGEDLVGEKFCIMTTDEFSVGMSRECYDDLIHEIIKENVTKEETST